MRFEEAQTIFQTQSLCPECLKRIPAIRIERGNDLFMKKTCPDHGEFEVLLWRGHPSYRDWVSPKIPSYPDRPGSEVVGGCPFDCGLCPEHRQQTCTALMEVTQRCNLRCAFCFADANKPSSMDPDMATIREWYEALLINAKPCNIQLSGGEPTIRDDLPDIVALGRSLGFGFIQVNTNGLRLGDDPAYAKKLKTAGLASVFLQFDGMREDIYLQLRGQACLQPKLAAVETCRQLGIGVVLVPTVVRDVNDNELGSIVKFALKNLDVIRGVHVQPVSFFGRYPTTPTDIERITIPEIVQKLEAQTDGLLKIEDFKPPGCENALCSFNGSFVLMPDSSVIALTNHKSVGCGCSRENAAEGASKSRKFVARNWSGRENKTPSNSKSDFSMGHWDILFERASTHNLCISGMAFQDVWNIDTDRLRDCCIHVISPDGRLIPFCAYNVTSANGRSLYGRGR
ncbi:MAG: radical SAM protein [Pseudomonadota bacterium]